MIVLLLVRFVTAYSVRFIDCCCAQTTVRLWHELHVERRIAHDFLEMLSPSRQRTHAFVAAVKHNDIRAIALCTREASSSGLIVQSIAHAPAQPDAGAALLRGMHRKYSVRVDWAAIRRQPQWYFEMILVQHELDQTENVTAEAREG